MPHEVTITKTVEFDAGHRVPDHKSKCRNMHGHRYKLLVTLSGIVIDEPGSSDNGMVVDFGDVKDIATKVIHDRFDHAFIVWEQDTLGLEALRVLGDSHNTVVVPFVPTAENLAAYCFDLLDGAFNRVYSSNTNGVQLHCVRLFETPNSYADCHRTE